MRVLNIPRRITDNRRTRQGKIALAVWMAVKFAYGNSTKYGISKDGIKSFLHCGERMAKTVFKILWDNPELFYVNERKGCVFAKSCKSREVKVANRRDRITYRGDDVITVHVPDCYENGETETLRNLLLLVDYFLICKEYDRQAKYKSSGRGHKGCNGVCETEMLKSQLFMAKKVGLNRTTLSRRVKRLVEMGYVTKTDAHIERSTPSDPKAFEAVNKLTRLPYWLVSFPVVLNLTDGCPFIYRHIIWDSKKRTKSKVASKTMTERYLDGSMVDQERVRFYFEYFHD